MHTRSYHIEHKTVQVDFDINLTEWLATLGNIVIVTDEQVQLIHGAKWNDYPVLTMPAGESAKTSAVWFGMLETFLSWGITTDHTIVGIGGGVVTDVAGFVASVYKRGLPLVLVPTTLLAMVDAALGGKNGINAGDWKNMFGTIHQPQRIGYDFDLLQTLPHLEWVNGMAEVIKHTWIADSDLMTDLEHADWNKIKNDRSFLLSLIERNVEIKMNIVARDPSDKKERRWLNFGHTIGHAIERQLSMAHGKAVAIGMLAAIGYSGKLSGQKNNWVDRMLHLLLKYDLPVHAAVNHHEVCRAILQDKKRSATHLNFILLKGPAQPYFHEIPLNILPMVMEEMLCFIKPDSDEQPVITK